MKFIVFSCGTSQTFPERLGLREECSQCRNDLHVCKNCRFYDPGSYNDCKESSAEVVLEKERANFCDYFDAGSGTYSQSETQKLKDAAEALFKKN